MHTQLLAFLIFAQSFNACRQAPETVLSPTVDNVFQAGLTVGLQSPKKARVAATNVIFQSNDNGQTWQDVSAGLPEDSQGGYVFANGNEVFLSTGSGHLYRGTPGFVGMNWEMEDWLNENITGIFPGRSGPYAASFGNGLFKKIAGTNIWKPMYQGLKDLAVYSVLETPDGAVFAGCHSGVYKSTDNGESWKKVFADGGPIIRLVAADGVLLGNSPRGTLRSTDGGEHWDWAPTEAGEVLETGRIEGLFFSIVNDVRAVADPEVPKRVYTSADGQNWQRMEERLLPARIIYNLVQAGEFLLCSTNTGIFRSSDRGKTWELVRAANGERNMLAVSGRTIFIVPFRGGC